MSTRIGLYEVAAIRDKRRNRNGQTEYLIRWKGYGSASDSWEPEFNIRAGAEKLIAEYNKTHATPERAARARSRSRGRSRSRSRSATRTTSRSKSRGANSAKKTSNTNTNKKSTPASKSKSGRKSSKVEVEQEEEEEEEEEDKKPKRSASKGSSGRVPRRARSNISAAEKTPERSISRSRTQRMDEDSTSSSLNPSRAPESASIHPAAKTPSIITYTSSTTNTASADLFGTDLFKAVLPGCWFYLITVMIIHFLVLVAVEMHFGHGRLSSTLQRGLVKYIMFTETGAAKLFDIVVKQLRLFELVSIPLYLAANSALRRSTSECYSNNIVADARASQLSNVLNGICSICTLFLLHHYNLWATYLGVRIIANIVFSYYLSEQILNCRVHSTAARLQYTALIALAGWILFAGYFTGKAKELEAAGSLGIQQALLYGFIFVICAETAKYEAQLVGSQQGTSNVLYQLLNVLLHGLYVLSVPVFTYFFMNSAVWTSASSTHGQLSLIQATAAVAFIFTNAFTSLLDQEHWRNAQN